MAGSAPGKILLVEDEALVAMALEGMLSDLGYEVVMAGNLAEALAAIGREPLIGALLDLNLAGTRSLPVAEALAARGLPFAFMTGYADREIDRRFSHAPVLRKPFDEHQLRKVLATAIPPPRDGG